MSDKRIKIGGRLHSIATDNIVAGANSILDDKQEKTQEDINALVIDAIEDIEAEIGEAPQGVTESIHNRITQLRNDLQAAQIAAGVVAWDEIPTKGSSNLVNSNALFNKFSAVEASLTGELLPISIISGYRLNWSSDANRGYYVSTSGNSVYIFNVTQYKGKTLKVSRRRKENTFHYAFVTDYTRIPSGTPDVTTWDEILISGTRCNTTDSADTITTSSYTVPSNEGDVFLCISCYTDTCTVIDTTEGLTYKIEQLQQNKQEVLQFDNIPTKNSTNPVTSNAIYNSITNLNKDINGFIDPVLIKNGYRIIYAGTRGYYYSESGHAVYIYDVTDYQNKYIQLLYKRVANSYSWAFVSDYTLIPSGSQDLETWNNILISSSGQNSTTDSTIYTGRLLVPNNNYEHLYLCITTNKVAGCVASSESDSIKLAIQDLKANKQDILTFDNIPTKNSINPVTSNGVYEAVKPILGVDGILTPIFTKNGYRILYSGSAKGYYYGHSNASVLIYDVSQLKGKRVSIRQTQVSSNGYAYAFVKDYLSIPTSKDEETWNSILISGLRETDTAASNYVTRALTVPNGEYENVYLCVEQSNSYPASLTDIEAVVEPLTLEDLQEIRKGSDTSGNITYQNEKLGIASITPIKYDYNIIIGYGQSLAAGSGYQAEDLPQDDNAKMLFLKYSSTSNDVTTRTLRNISCVGNTSETQDFPPNASATIDFAKLYKLKTGNTDRIFVHVCPAQGSMTIAQLMDFARYKDKTVEGAGNFDFENLDTGYASVRPYYAFKRQLTRLKALADAAGKTIGVIAVNWNQGEADYGSQSGTPATTTTDYNCNGNAEEYIARLTALHDDMWADMQSILGQTEQPAWFIAQCSGSFVKSSFTINQALIDICDNKRYFQTHSTYPVPNKSADGHPTGNGYRWYGEYLAKAMADVLLRNIKPDLVSVKKIVAKADKIRIYCRVPNPPLRTELKMLAEVNNYGFALRNADDSANVAIGSVVIVNDTIVITPASKLTSGTSYILHYSTYYATNKANSSYRAEGNICDSDEYNSNFICMQEITTPEYQPLDAEGNTMVGKPYPLWNFLVPFKKTITVE